MKHWKKIVYGLILVWTGVLASLMASENAFAETGVTEDGLYYSVNEDGKTVTIIDYNRETSSGDITIPSAIDGKTVTRIGDGAFAEGVRANYSDTDSPITYTTPSQQNLLNAINEDISENTFYGSSYNYNNRLKSITIPDSIIFIDDNAFMACENLTDIIIPNSVTSIGNSIFYGCTRLFNITISNNITSIGDYAFRSCTRLLNITIPDNVISIGDYAFCGCHNLTNITIPDNVISIGDYAFYGCAYTTDNSRDGLRTISISNSVTSIGKGTFENCSYLTDITIPDSVTSIGDYAFYRCSNLTDITIPNSVTSIGNSAFKDCFSLTDITISGNNVSVADSAFTNCDSLTSITISGNNVSISGNAFSGICHPTSITISGNNTSIGDGAFSECASLTNVTISGNNTSISNYAFSDCDGLSGIILLDGIASIGDGAFSECDSLSNITISGDNVPIGDRAFYGCDNLTSIILLNDIFSVGNGAFSYCSNLQTVIIPDSITKLGEDLYQKSNYHNDKYSTIDVYYTGSESNWEKISNPLFDYQADIAMHFNSTFPKQISLDTSTTNFSIGEPLKLSATITPTDVTANKIIWRICNNNADIHFTDENIAGQDFAVGKEIEITAVSPGTATITAQTANGLTTSVEVTVTDSSDNPCDIQGHKEEVMPTINATCTDNGYTQGIYCTVCGQILLPQEVISALGHTWSEWATIGNISETRHCTVCGQTETRTKQSTNPPVSNDPLPSTPKPAPTTRPTSTPIPRPDRKVPSNIKKVTKLTVKNKKKKTATLSWKKVTNADGYELQYATSKKFRSSKKKKTPNTKISIKKLKKGKTYYFRVRAYKKQGKKTIYGKWSNVKKIKIRK